MAQVTGRPNHGGLNLAGVDHRPHPLHNVTRRAVRPYNYSPLGPATRHVASPLKNPKVK